MVLMVVALCWGGYLGTAVFRTVGHVFNVFSAGGYYYWGELWLFSSPRINRGKTAPGGGCGSRSRQMTLPSNARTHWAVTWLPVNAYADIINILIFSPTMSNLESELLFRILVMITNFSQRHYSS